MTSPRDSRDSSHSSATVPQPTYYYHQQAPHSAPIPRPSRTQTMPHNYAYPMDSKYPYTVQQPQAVGFPTGYTGYPGKQQHFDVANAPQYPHSMYQTKPPPLLKRLFMGLTGGNKYAQPKVPRRKRSSSF
ncbi:hypothetical protein NLJ89_g8030 [Agrocybe chaxingu]|uniref:Uncharacterized protein n=1 Tax=Agrocybe chaxingu TaxID=84603 RepID=A0A9W8MUW3_9AGAR|nr:hypothetical protein NLJ89_g8030 [Agrocybe chaxingu]